MSQTLCIQASLESSHLRRYPTVEVGGDDYSGVCIESILRGIDPAVTAWNLRNRLFWKRGTVPERIYPSGVARGAELLELRGN